MEITHLKVVAKVIILEPRRVCCKNNAKICERVSPSFYHISKKPLGLLDYEHATSQVFCKRASRLLSAITHIECVGYGKKIDLFENMGRSIGPVWL